MSLSASGRCSSGGLSGSSSAVVALWQCCACGREWRAECVYGDETECCPFAPKVLSFGARSAWGMDWSDASQAVDSVKEDCLEDDLSNSTSPGSTRSRQTSTCIGSPGSCPAVDDGAKLETWPLPSSSTLKVQRPPPPSHVDSSTDRD
eukprot:CAMPEP_0115157674 /NCGR_PEP_ID=MMETSP0227-20121206/69163_1 /TAXON_ID=89957 /ORGANISM="Polarella glacialis, Strain CCMP 1383" /LENGTH=147 /DNA_ID=CAMNT_0002569051 /DNA_START=126 /DNA_END=569 /DNA_ORIENTATION=+